MGETSGPLSATEAADGVGDACDTCTDRFNPRIGGPPPGIRTTVGGQLDDDGDGYGTACDFDYDQVGFFLGPTDFAEAVASSQVFLANVETGLNCGTGAFSTRCSLFDHDEAGLFLSPADFAEDVNGSVIFLKTNGPRCAVACVPPFTGAVGSLTCQGACCAAGGAVCP